MKSTSSIIYVLFGTIILVAYLAIEVRGVVFGGTDGYTETGSSASSGGARGRTTGGWGWFIGYHGGK